MLNDKTSTPWQVIKRSYARYKKNGWEGMLIRLDRDCIKLQVILPAKMQKREDYKKWIKLHETDIMHTKFLKTNPKISIIVPIQNVVERYLLEMLDSVITQTYSNWELNLSYDDLTDDETMLILKKYVAKHKNITLFKTLSSSVHLAKGGYVCFLETDASLAPNALYEIVKKLNEQPELKLIYSDSDAIDKKSKRSNPHFKSGWNPDMFFSMNYIEDFFVIKKDIMDMLDANKRGYKLLLESLEHIEYKEIGNIEKILYHQRVLGASSIDAKEELKALQNYFSTKGKYVDVSNGILLGTYKVHYKYPTYPLVTLLIPTRDGYEILIKCIESILKKTIYPNYEIIVLDNESQCEKTLAYFEEIKKHNNITILEYHHPFNYSAINNFGVKHANGEVIGLINNDVEVISEGWLSEMVTHALREDIGAVGAMLYYDDDTIQHAGVVGLHTGAGHSHKFFKRGSDGYFGRLKVVQNYSAVTAACLVVRKELYEEVGGLNEENLKIAFNDVDFCFKLKEKGYRNLWTPYAELYHHESVSRGKEDTAHKIKRAREEEEYMRKRWKEKLQNDRHYNKNLTKLHENFDFNLTMLK